MSKVKIKGNASGTGVLTIEAPNTDTDRTITLPDEDITLGATGANAALSNLSGVTGTSGQVMTSDGSGGATMQDAAGGGGAMELISTTTVSSSVASVAFTSLSGYDTYKLVYHCKLASHGYITGQLQNSGSNVTEYKTFRRNNSTTSTLYTRSWIDLHSSYGIGFSGEILLNTVNHTFQHLGVKQRTDVEDSIETVEVFTEINPSSYTVSSLNGISLDATTNIATGVFSLYGIKDS